MSAPVVSGFTSAAAITIATSQLKGIFGVKVRACALAVLAWHQARFGESTEAWVLRGEARVAVGICKLKAGAARSVSRNELTGCIGHALWRKLFV